MTKNLFILIFSLAITMALCSCKQSESIAQPSVKKTEGLLSWDDGEKRNEWSQHLLKVIDEQWGYYEQAQDINIFCPKIDRLNVDTQKLVVAELIVWMSFYESTWNPTARYHEKTMGIDPVTKHPVHSEGLMQMSYQDTQWAKYCEFDWSIDKNLSATDPNKTIFDPKKNLSCAVKVLARQIDRTGKIVLSRGVYWAVIKDGGRYSKISNIKKRIETAVPSCI